MGKVKAMPGASLDRYSLTSDGIPFPSRPCFNWLPQYRYGLFAYKALQEACAARLTRGGNALSFTAGRHGAADVPTHLVRPVLMDAVLGGGGWLGYVLGQAQDSLERFATGEFFQPLTADVALIVAKEEGFWRASQQHPLLHDPRPAIPRGLARARRRL